MFLWKKKKVNKTTQRYSCEACIYWPSPQNDYMTIDPGEIPGFHLKTTVLNTTPWFHNPSLGQDLSDIHAREQLLRVLGQGLLRKWEVRPSKRKRNFLSRYFSMIWYICHSRVSLDSNFFLSSSPIPFSSVCYFFPMVLVCFCLLAHFFYSKTFPKPGVQVIFA